MDRKEFDLMFKKESPLFKDSLLGDLVRNALLEEKVPHSKRSFSAGQHDVYSIYEKGTSLGKSREINSLAETGLQRGSNTFKFREYISKSKTFSESKSNSLAGSGSSSHTLSPLSVSTIIQNSQQSTSQAPSLVSESLPDVDLSRQCQQNSWNMQPNGDNSSCKHSEHSRTLDVNDMAPTSADISIPEDISNSAWGLPKYSRKNDANDTCVTNEYLSPQISLPIYSQTEFSSYQYQAVFHGTKFEGNISVTSLTNEASCRFKDATAVSKAHGLCQQLTSPSRQVEDRPNIKGEIRETKSEVQKPETRFRRSVTTFPVEIGRVGEEEMVAIIKTLVQAQTCYTQCPIDEQNECLQKSEFYGSEFAVLRERAKDASETRRRLMDSVVNQFEQKIVETVKFAKRIPGFLDLPRDDQANLIKASRNESELISGMKRVNVTNLVFNSRDGQKFNIEDMKTLFPQQLIDMFIEGGRKVAKLNATTEEQAVIRAIIITFSDRCELSCREKVEDIQNRMVSCLLYVVRKRPVQFGVRIGQLFDFLLFCRKITDVALKTMKDILLESEKYSSNPMIKDVM